MVLTKSDHEALRNKLEDYYSARATLRDVPRDAPENRRAAASKKENTAREKFLKDWEGRNGKKDALVSVPDLRAIFSGCFTYDRQSGNGDVRGMKPKDWPAYDVVLSKKYRAEHATPSVVLMRGHDADRGWASARDWYGATWKAAAEAAEYAFVLPDVDDSIDFDPVVDLSKQEGEATDGKRREVILGGLGAASQAVNIDRDRLYLDCGRGSCRFALRLATYSPHLFAGLVLREPVDPGDLALDSLAGVPVLLLRTAATKDVCERLAAALDKGQAGTATVLDAKGEYPHAESAADIATWMGARTRDMFRSRVVIANTHDRLKRAFWVFMGTAEPIADVPPDARPRLEVVADRATNKITVTARGVLDFSLLLNDAIVDLDQEITTIINGKAQPPFKVERSLKKLLDYVFLYRDPAMLFVTERGFEVPVEKAEEKPVDDKAAAPKEAKGDAPTSK